MTITALGAAALLSSCGRGAAPLPLLQQNEDAVRTAGVPSPYAVIYPFGGGEGGENAATQLTFDTQGNAYGTTVQGGNAGCGMVFRLHPSSSGQWQERVLYSFSCASDGKNPHGGVIRDAQDNLYGTTTAGGIGGGCTGDGCGVVFKIAHGGGESVLYTFRGRDDGFGPGSPLAFDSRGNLYGTAPDGGRFGLGTVFELERNSGSWHFGVIHQFTGGKGGRTGSLGALLVDASGVIYGVTELGGTNQAGIAYRMKNISGLNWSFTPVYAFKGQPDGANPYGGLIESAGKLYGTTYYGGSGGAGSIFELTPKTGFFGERVLYSFKGGTDGSSPTSTLVAGSNGMLYGTTSAGGSTGCDCGTAFSLVPGTLVERVLHRFGARNDGQYPYYGFTLFGNSLFSSTVAGGNSGNGTIFRFTP